MKILLLLLMILPINIIGHDKIEVIKYHNLEEIFNEADGKVKIINFWATWCKPCIEELPEFEAINDKYKWVKVVLISLDDVEVLQKKVLPFVKKIGLQSDVKLLDETDYNSIIDKIHPEWSGAIPATLIIDKKGKKHLYEKEFKKGELQNLIANFIQ
jgi:thiol-disulfide isomerase/thioredoxin